MAIFAPSRAKTMAISLPMPLAAPVTIATLSFRRMALPIPKRDQKLKPNSRARLSRDQA